MKEAKECCKHGNVLVSEQLTCRICVEHRKAESRKANAAEHPPRSGFKTESQSRVDRLCRSTLGAFCWGRPQG